MPQIPNSTPQMNRAELMAAIHAKFPDFKLDRFAVVGMRGYYLNSMGKPGLNDRAMYDDALFLMSDDELHSFNANCDPSRYKPGIASLQPGVWKVYKFDIHGGKASQYPAICQRFGKVTVKRDGGKLDTGNFGINIHKGGYSTTSSLGCQTLPPTQWDRFYGTAERMAKAIYGKSYDKQVITYVLIEK